MEENPMKREEERLKTFRDWPSSANIGPETLARAGFFHTGPEDAVECAFCAGILHNWQVNDQAFLRHQQIFPHCPFIADPIGCGNVPKTQHIRATSRASVVDLSTAAPSNQPASPADPLPLREELGRLATFNQWPKWKTLPPQRFAKAGFFYIGSSDTVQCAYCGGRLKDWVQGDDPMQEHRSHFPNCTFFSSLPTSSREEDLESRLKRSLKELGLYLPSLTNSAYSTFQSRLQSFKDWPPDKKQQPPDLAKAGFFYSGTADNVSCFHCGAGLRNWLPEDCAFREHRRWFPDCDYVFLTRGESCESTICSCRRGSSQSEQSKAEKPEEEVAKELRELREERLCKICFDVQAGVVLLPCGHLCCCAVCAPPLRNCPICRGDVKAVVRTYF